MTKAALYLRISKDRTGEGLGVDRQKEDCLELAEKSGWTVAEIYIDNDVSAMSNKPRKQYQRMLEDLETGKAEAIIAWHPDRLYRKVTDLADLVETCKRHNIQISTVRSGHVDLSTASGRLVAGLLAQVAMYEGEHKAERWIRAWRQGREQGVPVATGTRMFGYTRDGEVIPDEAATAQKMFKDFISGVSILQIARNLQRDGIPTTRSSEWRTGTVRQYLNNPRLAAWSTLGRDVPTGKLDKHRRPITRRVFDIVGEGQWEPIIDRETWEAARAILSSRTREKPLRIALLPGLIHCGKCGHKLITGNARGKRSYRCPSRRPGLDGCGGTSAYAQPIEEIVESYAKARLSDPRVTARIVSLRSVDGTGELVAEASALEARLLELEVTLDKPGMPVASITRAMARARERLTEVQADLAAASASEPAAAVLAGASWPDDLGRRHKLVKIALGDERVFLDPVKDRARHSTWDPSRVRISPAETV